MLGQDQVRHEAGQTLFLRSAFPGELWSQLDKGKWAFFCLVDWQMLINEQNKHPNNPVIKKWVDKMADEHGQHTLK